MSKKGKEVDPSPARLKESRNEVQRRTSLAEERRKLDEDRRKLYEDLRKLDEDKRKIDEERQKLEEERRKLDEERRKSNELLRLNSTVLKAPLQQASKPTNEECDSRAEASSSSCNTQNVVACDRIKGDKNPFKQRRKSTKTSGSEDEQTKKGGEQRRKSTKTSGSEDEQTKKGGANALPVSRSVKSSEGEEEHIPSKRGGLKEASNVNTKSSSNIDTKKISSLHRKKQISSPKLSTSANNSGSKVGPNCIPELKHDGALTKSLNQSNEHMTGHEAVSKHSKSNSDKRVGLSASQVNPENRFPVTEEAPADVQVKSKALIQSPEQKSKRPSKMEDAVLTVPLPQDTSIDFQKKESANNDTPKKKSKKSSKMEDNTEVVSITMTPMTQDSSADFLMKEAASDIEKNSKGSMSQNTRKYSRKHVKVDNVMKQSEGDGHQLTKDESNIGADYLHNLEHFDKLTASTTLMESRPQHALDETRQKEDNLIAEIEEHGKTNPPALKRKFADLEHSSVLKERVMKGKKNCASFVKPGASVKDHSSIVERQPVVVVKRLDPEIIAKMSPPKVKIVKQDNQLFLRESSQVSSTFKIPSTELFIKPSIPKKNPSVKNRVSAIAKSRNVAKRTGKPQKMSKLIESKGQKNPIEFSESNCQLSDPLSDWHKPKKSVDPMEELRADSEELDYEPGAGDDDDAMSLYADSNIFRNEDEADVSEDSLVQRQAGDSDMDSDASSDSRRLSDMEIDSDDDDHHHGIPADAQEVADDSSVVGKHTSAPSSPKESVIGIPVEVYPSSILPSKRDSVESGELVDDDDSSSHGLVETKSAKCNEEKLNKSESLVSPLQRSGKDCIGNLMGVKDDLKGDKRRQRSLQMTRTSELSKLSSSSNTSGSSVQVPLRRPETCRTVSPFTPTQETNKISELQAPYKPFECEMGDANMLTTDFPGVYFEPPIKVCPKPPPFSHSTGHLQTPDHCIRAVPSTSVAMPLQQDNQNFNEYPEPPPPLGSGGHVMPAPILTSKSPVSLINQTAENQQLLISQFLQNMRPNGALAPTSGPKPSISTASTSNESSLGIHPINEQSRHFLMSLTDFDFRHQIDVGPRPLESPKITDDPVDNPIGNYCSNYLTSGTCEIYDCLKIHEYPQLILDDGTKIKESIKLIEEMLSKYPHWRDKQFSSTVEMLGNLCDKISLRRIADYFWELCCDFKKKKLPEPDFNCWEQLARAYSLCGLKPAFCCKAVLGILSHRKQTIRRENYAVIDSIVDKLFDEFIMGKSDLWFCLGILAAIKDYEIPANVMREILRDTLNEPWDIVSHRAVCDYLLRSPRIEQPRKPEEPQLLHFIHKLLFALQQKEVTLQHAQKLAGYFNIDLKNDCCVDYAEKIKLYARPAVGFRSPRFTLCAFPAPFLNESSHTNQHDNLQSRVDNSVLKSASASVSFVPCSTLQNAKNGRNSQDCGAAQSSGELNLNTMEVEVQPCTEFINSMPLPAIDQDVRNLEATSVNRVVSTASNHNFSYHETAPPVRLSTDIGKVAQAPISPSSLKLKIVVDPNKEGRKIMAPLPPNQNEEPSPTTVKSSKPSRSEPEEPPLLNLIKQNKCGKAAKYIISWTQYKNNSHRILTITDTLLSQSPIVRKRNFEHLLQAIAVQMAGKLCVQMKTILITVGLGILENFLQNDLFTEAKEVHDVLWKKLNPPSVQMEKYSLSYLELITAWVCVKNEKVKEAVSIVISNSFYGSCKYWAMPSNPSDEDLRDQVCSALFHHCKELEEFVLDAETLFRYMLQSKESYKIDIAKFLDDILRALVKYAPTNRVLALLTWAHNEFNLQPHRETNRLLLCYISSLPVNSGFTPEMLFLLEQEPYNEAFPKPIQGSSRINICFQSVWNTVEVHNIFLFLLNCHLCNLPSTVQEIPLITVEIKECPLPTPAPGEFMFPHDLVEIDASVSAMQDRVLDVISDLPLRTNSRFENGVLTLDKISVHGYISKRRGAEDRLRSANQGSSREGPPFSGRMHSQYANAPYVGNQGPLNIPSAPFEANQWTENYPNMPITGYYAGDQYWGWPQQPPNLENRPYAYGHFRGQHRQGRPYHHQSYRGKQRPL